MSRRSRLATRLARAAVARPGRRHLRRRHAAVRDAVGSGHRPVLVLDEQPAHPARGRRRRPRRRRLAAGQSVPRRSPTARAEAAKNGYTHGVGGYTVTPVPDPSNDRRLMVNITGPVGTYFARIVGINSFQASRDAKADFVLPVPMGSPENYYGVGYLIEPVTTTTTRTPTASSRTNIATTSAARRAASGASTRASATTSGTSSTTTTTDYAYRADERPGPAVGQVRPALRPDRQPVAGTVDRYRGPPVGRAASRARCADTRIAVALSWNNGANWTTTTTETPNLTTTQSQYLPSATVSTLTRVGRPHLGRRRTSATATSASG